MYSVYIVGGSKKVTDEMTEGIPWSSYGFTVIGSGTDPYRAAEEIIAMGPQVVIFDKENPGMDSRVFMGRIRAVHMDCRFIMLTEYYSLKAMRFFFKRGGHDYLLKPFNGQDAAHYLRELSGSLASAW